MSDLNTSSNIMLLGADLSSGGQGTHFRNLAKGVFGGGADVVLLKSDSEKFVSQLARPPLQLRCERDLDYLRVIRQLRKTVSERKTSVIFAFGAYPSIVAWLTARGMSQGPKVITCEINRPSLSMANPKYRRRPQTIVKNGLVVKAYRSAACYSANSIDGVEEATRLFAVDPSRTVRVPNVIFADDLRKKANLRASEDKPGVLRIVQACRLEQWKRIDTTLHAMALAGKEVPIEFTVIGDGAKRQELEALAAKLGVAARTTFVGWRDDPEGFIKNSDVSITSSEYEGFSNSVLEAMFLGVPNALSLSNSDAVDMSQTGAVVGFDVGDHEKLAQHFVRLAKDANFRCAVADTGSRYAEGHDAPVALDFYERVLTAVGNGQPIPHEYPESSR